MSGILLIGIPGALILELTNLLYRFLGVDPLNMHGDIVWPTAIMISLLWPLAITPISFLYYKIRPQHSLLSRWIVSLMGSFILTTAVVFLLYK